MWQKRANMSDEATRSEAFYKLNSDQRKRYLCKLSLIDGVDPYSLKKADFTEEPSILPPLR